ncbi:hypothetical protein SODG_005668 [Sodalis praecaptivus]|nr:hypothetical protein NVIRENTERO_02884 [Sodalis praecaptivus]
MTTVPNAMWKKRPYGQIAKCAEAQALRKAWPEIGQQPTAEEMEGKTLDVIDARNVTPSAGHSTSHEGATTETLQAINDLLLSLEKTWDEDFLPLCSTVFKRQFSKAAELTDQEALKALDFLRKRAAKDAA